MRAVNMEFIQLFLTKEDFPAEARDSLLESAEALRAKGLEEAADGAVEFFTENDFSVEQTQPLVEELAANGDLSPYTVWMLLLIQAAERALPAYLERGVPEDVFWDTFCDLRYKALECREIYGVWGTFVAFWYPIFYSCDIVKLGRLEYEAITWPWDQPYCQNGVTVKKGDRVWNIHIPSSGEPFDREARLDSYRRAYEFFREELNGGPLVCVCHSWLLYPEYGKILPPASNVAGFQRDFDLVGQDVAEEFDDAWRLFGRDYQKSLEELPENTSMRRAFKKYLLAGGKPGEGRGVLVFDGELRSGQS